MLDIPGLPVLDKIALIGGCLRLPLRVDPAPLLAELQSMDPDVWGSRAGRVGVHRVAEAVFLRGYAPAEGDQPIEDRPILATLPALRHCVYELLPAPPQRGLLARLPPETVVAPHIDRAPYFSKTLRMHIPLETHPRAWMVVADEVYNMAAGEVWLLNNSTRHAVWNESATESRTHLICDYLPTAELLELMQRGERQLGRSLPEVLRRTAAARAVPGGVGG